MASSKKPARAAAAAPDKTEPVPPFEQTLGALEDVVQRLERGDLPLEDSLRAYEQGIGLVRAAQARLDAMDRRLEQLLADGTTAPLPGAASHHDDANEDDGDFDEDADESDDDDDEDA